MRTLKGASILLHGHKSTIDCQVRNLSEDGAKLTANSTISIPDRFDVKLDSGGEIRGCEVIWRTLTELGVRFSGER